MHFRFLLLLVPLSPHQGIIYAAEHHFASLCAAGGSLRRPSQTDPEDVPNDHDGGKGSDPPPLSPLRSLRRFNS